MTSVRSLVNALAGLAGRFSRADATRKLTLLNRLAVRRVGDPALLSRLHESLCFLQAYPDDQHILAAADRALADFSRRMDHLTPAARQRLHGSGIVGTSLTYPFGYAVARWLATGFPRHVDIAWNRTTDRDSLREVLGLLTLEAEEDALSEFGLEIRDWLHRAKGGRPISDLQLLVQLFARVRLSSATRDWLFESLALPIAWQLDGPSPSRTRARTPWPRPFYHGARLRTMSKGQRPTGVLNQIRRPPGRVRRASRPVANSIIDSARASLALRHRELHAFAYANPADVLVADLERGLRVSLVGIMPDFRLPLETFYGYLIQKNGVPVGYGGAWHLFGTLWFGINIFESFRRGQSAFITIQVLRLFYHALRMRDVVLEPFQTGHGNPEALRSGAFFFYHKLGFRPRDPAARRLLRRERGRLAADTSYRSPIPVLRRLARAEMYLPLSGRARDTRQPIRAADLAALVTDHVGQRHRGDRHVAVAAAVRQVARALAIPDRGLSTAAERRALRRLAPLLAFIPDLARWPIAEKRQLVRVIRAKAGRTETRYARLLDRRLRLRRSLARLLSAGPLRPTAQTPAATPRPRSLRASAERIEPSGVL